MTEAEKLIALAEGRAAQRYPDDADRARAWREGFLVAFEECEALANTMIAEARAATGTISLAEHNRRVAELLEANNRDVERRRAAEARAADMQRAIDFAEAIADFFDRENFLKAWREGDLKEWPEFAALSPSPAQPTPGDSQDIEVAVTASGQAGAPWPGLPEGDEPRGMPFGGQSN
jgi:hypothetical protein